MFDDFDKSFKRYAFASLAAGFVFYAVLITAIVLLLIHFL